MWPFANLTDILTKSVIASEQLDRSVSELARQIENVQVRQDLDAKMAELTIRLERAENQRKLDRTELQNRLDSEISSVTIKLSSVERELKSAIGNLVTGQGSILEALQKQVSSINGLRKILEPPPDLKLHSDLVNIPYVAHMPDSGTKL